MNNNMIKLKKIFEKVSAKGWIQSVCSGYAGIGATFEHEIGLSKNELEVPDFIDIEVKTKRKYSESYTTLFNASCDGEYLFEMKRLQDVYGWPDATFRECKILYSSVFGNQFSSFGYRFNVRLNVDHIQRKVFLNIYDRNFNLIDCQSSWSFDLLEEKLNRKLKYLAFVEADCKFCNGKEFFHYNSITFYSLKSFDTFLELLEQGNVRVTIKIGVYKFGNKIGKTYDHGTGFGILSNNLCMLYNKVD